MIRDRLLPAIRSWVNPPTPEAPTIPTPSPALSAAARLAEKQDSFYNSLTGLGGAYDKGAAARPTQRTPLAYEELERLYHQSGLCRRVVNLAPKEATRSGWEIHGIEEPKILRDISNLDKRLNIQQQVAHAWCWGRLYGHGIALIVTDEIGPVKLSDPIDPHKVRRIRSVVHCDGNEAWPLEWETDIGSPWFRMPRQWSISPHVSGVVAGGGFRPGEPIHASRVLYFPGVERPPSLLHDSRFGQFLGVSILTVLIDAIRDLLSISQAGAVMAQEMRMDVLKTSNRGAQNAAESQARTNARMAQIAQARSVLNLILLGEGEEYTTRAGTVSGFRDLYDAARQSIGAATGYPMVKLFGDTPAGMNTDGESWQQLWADDLGGEQEDVLYRPLRDFYTIAFACREGPFKGKPPEDWDIHFNPIHELSAGQTADVRLKNAQADAALVTAGILDPVHVARSRYGGPKYGNEILPIPEEDLLDLDVQREAEADMKRILAERTVVPPQPVAGQPPEAPATPAPPNPEDAPESQPAPKGDAEEQTFRRRQFTVPESARNNAQKVLDWRREHGDQVKGMTPAGWGRARQLAGEPSVSGQSLIEINAWFARHGEQEATRNVPEALKDTPWRDAGYVAWLGWGGDSMRTFAAERVAAARNTPATS